MSKKLAFILVMLLVLTAVLTACSSESADDGKDYVDAVLKGDAAAAQKVACDSYQEDTLALVEGYIALAGEQEAIRNIDLKFDMGKGNNEKEVIVTGSFDIVELNEQGKAVADSEQEYVLAYSTIDKHDFDQDHDDTNRINTRIVLDMEKSGDTWCVAKMSGGYVLLDGEQPSEAQ